MVNEIRNRIKKYLPMKKTQFLLIYILFLTFFVSYAINELFGQVNFRQILYHLYFTYLERLIWFDKRHTLKIFIYVVFVPLILSIITIYLFKFIKKIKYINNLSINLFLVFLLTVNIINLINKYSVLEFYNKEKNSSNFYEIHYKSPKITHTENKKNLIFIYIESMENLFSKENIFGKDLFKSIDNINYNKYSFNEFYQKLGTSWTIAGIVASHCGVPLSNFMYTKSNKFTYEVREFMPNITCLGDILRENGYKNVFIKTQDARFAGAEKFLKTHGYDEIKDKSYFEETKKINSQSDYELFKYLKKEVIELEKNSQPYNLTTLSFDMHHLSDNEERNESTYSDLCKHLNSNIYNNNLECVSIIVTDFINFLIKNNILENTILVVSGDHIAMKLTPEIKKVAGSQHERTIKNYFFTKDMYEKNREIIYHFDLFPTILYLLNFEFEENRFGLGASGFGKLSENFTIHKIDENANLNKELDSFSLKYNSFWSKK